MTTRPRTPLLALSLIVCVLGNMRAQGKVIDDGPQHRNQLSSIGEALRNARSRPLHILYVHGIAAVGAGDSNTFLSGLCSFLKDCHVPREGWKPLRRDYADSGEFASGAPPPTLEYMEEQVWASPEEWRASAPFVDHYVLRRNDGGPVVVDEINWWPLVFPLKCRKIMTGEAHLAGPAADLLNLCSSANQEDTNNPGRFKTYRWIDPDEVTQLKSIRSKAARINRGLKNNPLDWGFSDAMMAVGSMHNLFREGMRQLFVKAVRFNADESHPNAWRRQLNDPQAIDREFIVVSHSLGSYLVFSTLNMGEQDAVDASTQSPLDQPASAQTASAETQTQTQIKLSAKKAEKDEEDDAARYILERTSLVYFFANQVPLLELANMEGAKDAGLTLAQAKAQPATAGSLSTRMKKWKDLRENFRRRRGFAEESAAKPPQVVAWSDPSDLLTWRVPAIPDLVIDNLYVRNSWWHWLFVSPAAAHGNYAKNKDVLRIMLGPKASDTQSKIGK